MVAEEPLIARKKTGQFAGESITKGDLTAITAHI
jgi:hypothetical protein